MPDPTSLADSYPPWLDGETLPLTYHPVPDIAWAPVPMPALGQTTPKTADFTLPNNDRARLLQDLFSCG